MPTMLTLRKRARCIAPAAMLFAAMLILPTSPAAHGQGEPVNGMRPAELRTHAITGATVVTAPGTRIENATILIRAGVIDAVGADADIAVPPGARVWNGEGLTVYPGLIDAAVMISPSERPSSTGAHWNNRIQADLRMSEQPALPANLREELRKLGFTAAAVYPDSGILRGSGVVLALADDDEHVLTYRERAAMAAGFDYGGRRSGGGYPGSLMGAIALLRQTFHDAQWHDACTDVYDNHPQGNEPPAPAAALAALHDAIHAEQPVLFEVSDELNALRAARIAEEFNLDLVLLGSGTEFRRLKEIVALRRPIILPVDYPERPSVGTLSQANGLSLRELMTWEQAPTNARRLAEAGATVALTTHRLRRRSEFPANVRSAIQHGWSEDDALAALTTTPARLLGLDHAIGTIEPGKIANLVVVKGSLFEQDGKVRDVWINGRRHEISKDPDITLVARGTLTTSLGHELTTDIDSTKKSVSMDVPAGDPDAKPKRLRAKQVTVQRDQLSFITDGVVIDVDGYVRFSGVISGEGDDRELTGAGALPDGSTFTFTFAPVEALAEPDDGGKEGAGADAGDDAESDAGDEPEDPIAGTWALTATPEDTPDVVPVTLTVTRNEDGSLSAVMNAMQMDMPVENLSFDEPGGELRGSVIGPDGGSVALVLTIRGETLSGTATGETVRAELSGARRHARPDEVARGGDDGDGDDDDFEMPPDNLNVPLGEYGIVQSPRQQDLMIHGATIWTAGKQGVIEDGVLFVAGGKIAFVGSAEDWERSDSPHRLRSNITMIDGTGKHITPGLIDCHSHTGIDGGVNEFMQVNTAEVRIGDVIDPDDINWYRQLAGGLTAANQLHGSANPIGGQNSVVKLKWGGTADDYRVDDAIGGIKFALGENVVRSQNRYPNTRMGVETVIRDAFTAAGEYEAERARYDALPAREKARTMPPRRDIELDTLAEILRGDRIIHCHSYRQDEILMLIRIADDFGFTIGTLQHVLEGYKVAEAIAEHGAGASAFSDWWAYKVEVMDAIPYAGTLMHDVGVNVSFNSDSSELARRMNTEAAKAVRYGGLSPEEAIRFVTLNPARQLRIDHRTGSLEAGKDADFVIWSGDPLSTYTRCEQTWIEGAKFFDLEIDRELRAQVERERQRLIQKILRQQHGKPGDNPPRARPGNEGEADDPDVDSPPRRRRGPQRLMATVVERHLRWMEEQVRLGRDPEELRPGDCGCNDLELWLMLTR